MRHHSKTEPHVWVAKTMLLFFLCMFLNSYPATSLSIGVKEVYIEKLAQCADTDTPLILNSALLNYQKSTMTVNAQFTLKQPVSGKIDMVVELTKCQVRGEDTCEFNSRHRVMIDCRQLHAKNKIWSEYVEHIDNLPGKCPIPAGEYNMTDAQVSLKNMERLPLHVGYWKIVANGFYRRNIIFCIAAEVDIQTQRKRKIG